jgi:hypothetical protein
MLDIVWGVMLGVVLGIVVVSMLHVVECSKAMCSVKFPVRPAYFGHAISRHFQKFQSRCK